jgi:hypothetical protein
MCSCIRLSYHHHAEQVRAAGKSRDRVGINKALVQSVVQQGKGVACWGDGWCYCLGAWLLGCLPAGWLAGGPCLTHAAFVAGLASVVSALKVHLARPRQHMLDARWTAANGEVSERALAVNPRDGMVDPGSVPAVGTELKRVYL